MENAVCSGLRSLEEGGGVLYLKSGLQYFFPLLSSNEPDSYTVLDTFNGEEDILNHRCLIRFRIQGQDKDLFLIKVL